MTKAILHLGYPKTGTTYLQDKIFLQAADDMAIVTPTFENCGINIKRLKQEIANGHVACETRRKVTSRPVLLSIEGFVFDALRFVVGNKFCPTDFPLALKGLKSLCASLAPEDISIVLSVRRQDHLIHSLYAESYTYQLQWVPELNTIAKYVDAIIAPCEAALDPGYYYDFNRVLTEIRGQFPDSPIHIRSYENLARDPEREVAFWSELVGFDFKHITSRSNVRSAAPDAKVADRSGLRVHAVRLKTRLFPDLKLPNVLSRLVKKALSYMSVGEAREVEVTPEMRARLQAHFEPLNQEFIARECHSPLCSLEPNVSVELQHEDWSRP